MMPKPRSAERQAFKRWPMALFGALLAGMVGASSPGESVIAGGFRNLSTVDGLPSPRVFAITQDRDGFLWLATQNGLARYDGHTLRVFYHQPDDSTAIPDNYVTALAPSDDGGIWVGSHGGLVSRHDPLTEGFTTYDPQISTDCDIYLDELAWFHDRLLIAANGLFVFDPDTPDVPATQLLSDIDDDGCESTSPSIVPGTDGSLWLAGSAGLARWLPGDDAPHRIADLPSLGTACIDVDDHLLLAPSDGGLLRFDPIDGRVETIEAVAGMIFSTCHVDLRSGTAWLASTPFVHPTSAHLVELSPSRDQVVPHRPDRFVPGRPADSAYLEIAQDRDGVLWLGGVSQGVDRVDPRRAAFEHHLRSPTGDGLAMDHVIAVEPTADGGAWIGFFGGGMQRLNASRQPAEHWPAGPGGPRSGHVWDLLVDRSEQLWIAHETGLDRRTPDGAFSAVDPMPTTRALTLLERVDGTIWVGGARFLGTIVRGTVPAWRPWAGEQPSAPVLALADATEDRLWVGFDGGGLWRITPSSGAIERWDAATLGHGVVSSLVPQDDGSVLVGTLGAGLILVDPNAESPQRVDRRLSTDAVKGVLSDGEGGLWVSTDRGLAHVDPTTGAVHELDASDGLPSEGFANKAFGAANGRFWFGSIGGLVTFRPEQLIVRRPPPLAILTSLEILHRPVGLAPDDPTSPLQKPLHYTETLELTHRDRVVSIGFSALDFGAPERHRFRYRLDDFDTRWVEANADERFARYSSLPAGRFVFRVQASLDGTTWGESTTLDIRVYPPWWRSGWAIALYVALLVGGAGTVFERQRRQVKTLGGLLPICASCKKIRDDGGYWQEVEAYVTTRSRALFSHSLCPGCLEDSLAELDALDDET
ncbi:MAG: two-component regulator propeller domain-containing protein [Acidobacteriota bacterium]